LEPRLAKIVVRIAYDAPATLVVKRDGVVLGRASYGLSIPADPGHHVIEATAPGRTPFSKSIDLRAGNVEVVEISELPEAGPLVSASSPTAARSRIAARGEAFASGEMNVTETRGPVDRSGKGGSTQRWIGFSVGALGLVGIGAGVAFAVHAAGQSGDAEKYRRPGTNIYDEPGYSKNEAALESSRLAIGSAILGTAALAGGAFLYLTARSSPADDRRRAAARLAFTPNQVALEGWWP
jgi:serine/threonine-protein kinase